MRKLIGLIAVGVMLSIAHAASAGPFEDGLAAYNRGEYAIALKLWRPLADHRNAQAQNRVGDMYYEGKGVARDFLEAVKWYRLAVEQGDAEGQTNLGIAYATGHGVGQDYNEAVEWFRKAADQGYAKAQYSLGFRYYEGKGVPQDYGEAVKWTRKAADQGYANAQYGLGLMYYDGKGVPQDYGEAVKWTRKAADQGHAKAQSNVGSFYERGHGVTQDYGEAVKWTRKAADQGDVSAQWYLGIMFSESGHGIAQNYNEAVKWFRKAADQGLAAAQYDLGLMYYNGKGVPQDYNEAVMWFRKAASQGWLLAAWWLGSMYSSGKGVSQDYIRAYMWLNLAAASLIGETGKDATQNRQLVASKLTSAELSQAQAISRVCEQSNYKNCGEPEITPTANTNQAPAKMASVGGQQGASASARSVPMVNVGGTYAVPVLINNAITLNFVVDSGASDVSIPADVVSTLVRTGTISNVDFIGTQVYRLADGSTTPSSTFRIRSLKVGDRIIENVTGSVASASGPLLLGQSFLRRFKSWSIDNTKHVLVLE